MGVAACLPAWCLFSKDPGALPPYSLYRNEARSPGCD